MKRCLGCMETYDEQLNICPHCGYAENTTPDEAIHMVPGTVLQDRFIIGKVVGCGGFGVTYIAWDNVLQHKVAIKEYLPSEFSTRMPGISQLTIFEGDKTEQFGDGMQKFLDEARRLAKFQNEPGIVKIFDCFEENRTAYIVMEYLQGITLTQYLEEHGQIPEDEAVQMVLPILNSLKNVHREGIIHRDIAPDNIMVTDDGQVKLIDFGAARYATTSHSRSLTVIIKQGYSPVEQYQSRGNQGAYTDVYAMGSVLYRMITGSAPPDSMERNAYFENSRKDILEPLHKSVKRISENKENAILNAMNIRIEDRSPDMDTLIRQLTTDEPVARINGKIKRKDILQWPLWLKITIPMAMMGVIALLVLFVTGVIGFEFKKPREIYIPDGMTRVPRIVSMDEESAKNTLIEKQLNYMVVGTKNDKTIESGCVLTQNASVGSIVAINYSVEVVISAGIEQYEVPYMVGILKEDAVTALESSFTYEIVEEFDSVIEKGYVTKQSIDGGAEVDKGTLITLTISKGRNPEIEYEFEGDKMPNLVGLTLVEAMELCEKSGIKLVVTSYEYSTEYDGMCVLEQNTDEGAVIKADTIVEIVLSKGAQIFKVPSILYLTEEEAIAKLEERELKYKLLYEENETVAEGCVASQSIASGTVIDKDDVIEVIISTGPPKFEMVDVVGMTEAEAITTLQELGLVVTIEYKYDNSVQSGIVLSQSENKGNKVNKGYEIVLVVSSSEELIIVPSVVGKTYENAKKELEAAGFIVGKNDVYSNEEVKNTVINQTPSSGSGQKKGTKIVLTVSLGKEIVSENVTEEPTLSTIPSETEKVTEKESEKATEQSKEPTGIVVPEGCEFFDYSTGITLKAGEVFTGKIELYDELRTNDYIYHYGYYIDNSYYSEDGNWVSVIYKDDGWGVIVKDNTKSNYEELMGTIMGEPLKRTCYIDERRYYGTYQQCINLKEAPTIPNSVTEMQYTFWDCSSLEKAPAIPNGVTDMNSTFWYCSSLEEAPIIPNGVINMSNTFSHCTSLKEAPTIPNSVTDMSFTFYACSSLKKGPTIPNSVTSLLETFNSCSSLEEAPIIPNSVTKMFRTFKNCTNLKVAPVIPDGVVNMESTFSSCTSLEKAPIIPSSVTNMYATFEGCSNLIEVPNIPYGVTTLYNAFFGCSKLESIPEIPDSVEEMSFAFCDCTSLKEIKKISNSVINMEGAFAYCLNLTTVSEIPQSVVNMSSTFSWCTNLTGNICINANPAEYINCFNWIDFTAQNLTLSGTSTMLDELRATGTN